MSLLFKPLQVGDLNLPTVLSCSAHPLPSRCAGRSTPLMAEYHVQRASAGLILERSHRRHTDGRRLSRYPRYLVDEQVAGWKAVTSSSTRRVAGFSFSYGMSVVFPIHLI